MPKLQTEIPGTERPSIETIDEAALSLVHSTEQFNRWKRKRNDAKAHLISTLIEHEEDVERDEGGALIYSFYDGESAMEIRLERKDNLKMHSKPLTGPLEEVGSADEDEGELG